MLELWPKAIIEERNISMLHSFSFLGSIYASLHSSYCIY